MSQAGQLVTNAPITGVQYLEGNTGGQVPPNGSSTIFVIGSGDITVSGNAATNTLTISSSGISWTAISANQMLASNNGYFCTGGATLSLSLPAVSSVGDIIEVTLDGSTGWIITQGAGQHVRLGNQTSTAGVGGSIASTQQGDTLRMVCRIPNLTWNVLSVIGNPVVT